MTLALFGAVIAVYEIVNRQLNEDVSDQPKESSGNRSSVGVTAPSQAVLGSALLAAIVLPVVFLSIFVSWDLRRLSASRALAVGWDAPTKLERAQVWDKIQSEAPERESFTFSLFEQYLKVAKEQHDGGNPVEGLRLLNIGRNMLLEYERRDPFELDTQIGLSKTTSQLMAWGYNEYAQELADRAINLAESNLAYPTILGTSATALTSVGLHDLAIVYADMAIATEATTRPWAKAWYARGRALYELGFEDEAIETLITSTQKDPGAEGAILAHQVLAQIYESNGEIELSEKHEELGGGKITVQE
jgi:tetratricopeptide (TPR) repeat protein